MRVQVDPMPLVPDEEAARRRSVGGEARSAGQGHAFETSAKQIEIQQAVHRQQEPQAAQDGTDGIEGSVGSGTDGIGWGTQSIGGPEEPFLLQ